MGAGQGKIGGYKPPQHGMHISNHAGNYKCDMGSLKGCGEQHDQWVAAKRDWEQRCVIGAVKEYNQGNGVLGGTANVVKHLAQNAGCVGMEHKGR